MVTTIDKAIVAFLGAGLTIAAYVLGVDAGALEGLVGPVGALLTGVLTYLVPNRAA